MNQRDLDGAFLAAARRFWHPVFRSKDLAPGGVAHVRLLGEDLVLWRANDGRVGLLDDLCVHRGTKLSLGTVSGSGSIRCPYHAWEYDSGGRCTRIPQLPDRPIPPKARVAAHRADEHAGLVWGCLADAADEARPRPEFPELARPGYRLYVGDVMDWACQATREIENFLDVAHFSVVHLDVFGNPDVMTLDPYTVERSDDGWQLRTKIDYPGVSPMEPPLPDGSRRSTTIAFDYRVELPFAVHLGSSIMGVPYGLTVATQPVDATSCKVYWAIAIPEDQPASDEMLETMERMVFHADRRVVESQRPERLPLDLGAELHLSFDRMAVAYRRALADLGFPVAPWAS